MTAELPEADLSSALPALSGFTLLLSSVKGRERMKISGTYLPWEAGLYRIR